MVQVKSHVDDATHHVLARIGLGQARTFVYRVDSRPLSGILAVLLQLAFELHGLEAGQCAEAVGLVDRQ